MTTSSNRSSPIAANSTPLFATRGVSYRYGGAEASAVDDVSVAIPPGSFFAMLGPNGSGKSTLLRLLLGVLEPGAGSVHYLGRPIDSWRRRELARRIGAVPQIEEFTFPLTVRELVSMGRYPHLGAWRSEGAADRAAIDHALERCDVRELAGRPVATLSGGERQRARIARALAQQPSTLVLDEPTASLDIRHEMAIFRLLSTLAAEGVTVVLVTHNINLAARHATRLLLLHRGRRVALGSPAEVLTATTLENVYGWPVVVVPHPGPGADRGAPQVVPLASDPSTDAAPGNLSIPDSRK